MEEGKYFFYNDKFIPKGKAIISADNRGFRFGDGLFETMKMIDGNIPLLNYHFERLFSSLSLLNFQVPQYFTAAYLSEQIKKLAAKNQHVQSARIRLTIFRGDGGLYDYENDFSNCIIQTWEIKKQRLILNKTGLNTGVYTKAKKACDDFSHVKSNNYLPYIMAAMWAKENKLNDALILNCYNRIAEATIANIFLVKDGTIKTPPLNEGCVNGVMRRFIIESLRKENIPFKEAQIQIDELAEANEMFFTNAVSGIKWVRRCGNTTYSNKLAEYIGNHLKFLFV